LPRTLLFTTVGPLPSPSELQAWLTDQGEPFAQEGEHTTVLRALPLRLVVNTEGLRAEVELTEEVPLSRLVRVIFDLALRVGAEVRTANAGAVNRADLWVRLADEQDRLRIASALAHAEQRGQRDEVLTALWPVLCALGHGQDLRWDTARRSIVEVRDQRRAIERGEHDPLTEDEPTPVTSIATPVQGELHMLAWRWLAEAFPSLDTR
jgi:hypothetical protein